MSVWIDPPTDANRHDNAVRYRVSSKSDPHASYMVELDSYSANGECSCAHFEFRLRPLLARMLTPEQAVNQGLVKLYPKQRVDDALRCLHICEAREKFATDVLKAISENNKSHGAAI